MSFTSAQRLRLARIGLVLFAFMILTVEPQVFTSNRALFEVVRWVGFALIVAGALGRLYTMSFISGLKNATLVNYGPYSLCRNPLYFFSMLGAIGIGAMTGSVVMTLFVILVFFVTHLPQISGEERFLAGKFGKDYEEYRSSTPSILPRLTGYSSPETVSISPIVLNKAFRDALLWFLYVPFIVSVQLSRDADLLPQLFVLP